MTPSPRLLAFLAGGALLDLIAYSIRVSDYAARENDLFTLLALAAPCPSTSQW